MLKRRTFIQLIGLCSLSRPLQAVTRSEPVDQSAIVSATHWGREHNLIERYTFDTFVEGKSNQAARKIALQTAEKPGRRHNPLFLHSEVGLGKTHLAHAVGNRIVQKQPYITVLNTHAEHFWGLLRQAQDQNRLPQLRAELERVDLLLFDGVEQLACRNRSAEEFLRLTEILLKQRKQIIMVGDHPPQAIAHLDVRLKQHLESGQVVGIGAPDFQTRIDILERKKHGYDKPLSHEVAGFIASHSQTCVRDLEGALRDLIASATMEGRTTLTREYAKKVLANRLGLA